MTSNKLKQSRRGLLPSRPIPLREQKEGIKKDINNGDKVPLDTERLIGMTRIGQASVSPDGTLAVFEVKQYDFDAKKFDQQLWLADLEAVTATSGDNCDTGSPHLRQLTSGAQYGWTSANTPKFSPCGNYVAFLSDRKDRKKTSVWILPVKGPGEAKLLKEFPLSVGDLDWSHEANGIIVSASVYVDGKNINKQNENENDDTSDAMTTTAARDKVLEDSEGDLGGLNAVLFKRLPIREWDRWIDAKMAHPFFVPVKKSNPEEAPGYTVANDTPIDLLQGVPTAVPSGAFGGSEDWSVSSQGAVAVSARPPMAEDEAWTTNRHIYLIKQIPSSKSSEELSGENFEELLGECITKDNPGYDTNPVFSPDGKRLAWLTMKGPTYESDAVGILVYDLETKKTSTLLEAEKDWDYSPNSLKWSKDGKTLFFTADIRSKQALCSMDSTVGASGGKGIRILKSDQSSYLHGEVSASSSGHLLLASVQSLCMPTELFLIDSRAEKTSDQFRQLTNFNSQRIKDTNLGKAEEFIYKGDNDEDVQSWFIRPAGFPDQNNDSDHKNKHPLAVIYHGGPQGSTGDDWHYRWNLQYWASMGFAVFAPNFHGSTGFGHKFCRDISENWEVGGRDTIHGVKAILKEYSWLDPNRVVGLGASYGGYTSNWLNGNAPDGMFQALVCHCGIFDMRASYYATEELFFMEKEYGGPPYTDQNMLRDSQYSTYSPSAKVNEWKTPTLVIHGAKDFRLVESEGIATFTALQRQGVPSEFLYLPTENHHCLNPQNSMVWHETILSWICKWTNIPTTQTE